MRIPTTVPKRTGVLVLTLASALAFGLTGCASTPAPYEQMAVAEAAVQQARSDSTSENAAGELQIAIAKLASARQAMSRKDHERAAQLAEQAEIDAHVAVLRARSVRSRQAAQESQDAARVLLEEINRKSIR